jgi:hypothetical protein
MTFLWAVRDHAEIKRWRDDSLKKRIRPSRDGTENPIACKQAGLKADDQSMRSFTNREQSMLK